MLFRREARLFLRNRPRWIQYAILPSGLAIAAWIGDRWDAGPVAILVGAMALWCGPHFNMLMYERGGMTWLYLIPAPEQVILGAKVRLCLGALATTVILAVISTLPAKLTQPGTSVLVGCVGAVAVWSIAVGVVLSVDEPLSLEEWRTGAPQASGLVAFMGMIGICGAMALVTLVLLSTGAGISSVHFVSSGVALAGLSYGRLRTDSAAARMRASWELLLRHVRNSE
jgi:hypothetical protein